ncbi:Uncharacterized protein APZ42_020251 [Daphnia magna]|uniref:Uncharacterized protein n=1 Tax=Daphnia magna TaxID=35525 RepID=A0A164XN48_9CRUS|nr:Uncharacterized protein APZ42_020251 [Daphnia magna]
MIDARRTHATPSQRCLRDANVSFRRWVEGERKLSSICYKTPTLQSDFLIIFDDSFENILRENIRLRSGKHAETK